MSRYDPYEQLRLEQENKKLLEQVRTLTAELAGKHRAEWVMALAPRPINFTTEPTDMAGPNISRRPPFEIAKSRLLIADEVLHKSEADVWSHAGQKLQRAVEEVAKFRSPLDFMWRLTLERDYVK